MCYICKMKLKILTLIFLFSLGAHARQVESGGLLYSIIEEREGECELAGFSLSSEERVSVTVPSEIYSDGLSYKVTGIAERAFFEEGNLKSINMPSTIAIIKEEAFFKCESLEKVSLPADIVAIGERAFSRCVSLIKCEWLGNNLESLGFQAFSHCEALQNLMLPSNLRSLGDECFQNCRSIISVSIPAEVSYYGEGVFRGCVNLNSVLFKGKFEDVPDRMFEDCHALSEFSTPMPVRHIGERSFAGCASLETFDLTSLESLGRQSFSGCTSLKEVNITSSITEIPDGAFEHCMSMASAVFSGQVEVISVSSCEGCSSLVSIEIGGRCKEIEGKAFASCFSLKRICSKADIPPFISVTTFDPETYDTAELLVSYANLSRYRQGILWQDFAKILPVKADPSGINSPYVEPQLSATRHGDTIIFNNVEGMVSVTGTDGLIYFYGRCRPGDCVRVPVTTRVVILSDSGECVKL